MGPIVNYDSKFAPTNMHLALGSRNIVKVLSYFFSRDQIEL